MEEDIKKATQEIANLPQYIQSRVKEKLDYNLLSKDIMSSFNNLNDLLEGGEYKEMTRSKSELKIEEYINKSNKDVRSNEMFDFQTKEGTNFDLFVDIYNAFLREDEATARRLFKQLVRLVDEGDIDAGVAYAMLLYNGMGVKQNRAEAFSRLNEYKDVNNNATAQAIIGMYQFLTSYKKLGSNRGYQGARLEIKEAVQKGSRIAKSFYARHKRELN